MEGFTGSLKFGACVGRQSVLALKDVTMPSWFLGLRRVTVTTGSDNRSAQDDVLKPADDEYLLDDIDPDSDAMAQLVDALSL